MRRTFIFAMILGLACLPAALFAASGENGRPLTIAAGGYHTDSLTAAQRTSVAVADTLTTTNVLALPEIKVKGRTNIPVGLRFTNSGATVTVALAYVYKTAEDGSATDPAVNTIIDWSREVTITASTRQKEGSYYDGRYTFDSRGAVAVRVVFMTAVSAGTVDPWPGTH